MLKIKRTDFSISSYPHPPLFNACNPRRNSHHEFPLRQAKDFGRPFSLNVNTALGCIGEWNCEHELLRENKRMLDKSIREIERERQGLQTQEKKLILEIKKSAKQGQMVYLSSPFFMFLFCSV
ncbi:uncharacterized protein LOC131252934 isoform X1 [Magnolia sinica]|uniref:uncharacterized protein LOC131252934 isoform X1 n=1 Tax=Magnolia sinica TaxID=86752 RepID=UPI002659FADD|nr:uncharacterized protein LOC131252934 isoform X1 [Magnolia sinica]